MAPPARRWRDSIAVYRDRRMAFIFFFGMASGLPSSLVFATLSIWLREDGLSRTAIGLLGIVATPYAINFLWAPLVDRLRLPALGALGQRRAWILSCQAALCIAMVGMGLGDPIAAHGQIGGPLRRAGSVDHPRAADHQIMHAKPIFIRRRIFAAPST